MTTSADESHRRFPTLHTGDGLTVVGRDLGGVLRFRGIPYGAAPVGAARFARLAALDVRSCPPVVGRDDGLAAPQRPSVLDDLFDERRLPTGESCCVVHVDTPALDGSRPVLVWFHGGGFVTGSGAQPLYDAERLVRRGDIVVVTCNYRLGELGYLELGHLDPALRGSANNGLVDQLDVLRWVHDNITCFGGDPGSVTVAGHSAGAMSVAALVASAHSNGLVHQAILQSGAALASRTIVEAESIADRFCELASCGSVEELRALRVEDLLAARTALLAAAARGEAAFSHGGHAAGEVPPLFAFAPVLDGDVVPEAPLAALRSGAAAGIPMLLGTTRDEWRLFSATAGAHDDDEAATREVFARPAAATAEAQSHHAEVYRYLFTWPSRRFGGALGACHGIEVPFVFARATDPAMARYLGHGPSPDALEAAVADAWCAFVRCGDPSHERIGTWSPTKPGERTMMELGERCAMFDADATPAPELDALRDAR